MKLLASFLVVFSFLTACSSPEEKRKERQEEAQEQYDEDMKEAQEEYTEDNKEEAEDMVEDADEVKIDDQTIETED